MAKLYYDRYPFIKDWSNSQGKTALHVAAMRGNEEIVRVRDSLPSVQISSLQRCPDDSDCSHPIDRCYVTSAPTLT